MKFCLFNLLEEDDNPHPSMQEIRVAFGINLLCPHEIGEERTWLCAQNHTILTKEVL